MTATDDAPAAPLPASLDTALGRLRAALGRLEVAAGRRVLRAQDEPSARSGPDFAEIHGEALARLDRAEAIIRTVAGRLAAASDQPTDEAP